MSSFHLRHGWCSREELARALPASPALTELVVQVERRPQVTGNYRGTRETQQVRSWVAAAGVDWAPAGKVLRTAQATARSDEDRANVAWAAEIVAGLRDAEASEAVPHDEIAACLAGLATTDFPVCLLVSQPELALAVFGERGAGVTDDYRRPGRRTTRAFLTCLAYALGGVARMSPRDAWVGVGFGEFTDDAAPAICLDPADERWIADPDLGWVARHWHGVTGPVEPGVSAFVWLERRVAAHPEYRRALEALTPLRDALAMSPRDFVAVRRFQRASEAVMRATVEPATWDREPHRFWFTRLLSRTLMLPRATRETIVAAATAGAAHTGVSHDAASPRIPYPLRVAAARPKAVHLRAGEFFDWVVTPGAPPPRACTTLPPGCGVIVSIDGPGARIDGVDPNPQRAAARFAALLDARPRFCADPADEAFVGLRPPADLVDNRLVRPGGAEVDPGPCRAGDAVLAYTPLLSSATAPAFALELASPRYADVPDLIPRGFDPGPSVRASFGRVCPKGQVWLCTVADLAALRERVHRAQVLAAVYHLEVHARLGRPAWLTVLLQGQRTTIHTASLACWYYLLHELRTADMPVAMMPAAGDLTMECIVDMRGQPMPAQVIIR